jgi:hypothetical protein
MATTLAQELAGVAAHSDDAVRKTVADAIAASWKPQDMAWLPATDLASHIARVVEEGWHRYVGPDWPDRLITDEAHA